jgi:hypothetical protein
MDFSKPDGQDEVAGVERITRRASFWAFGLTNLGAALTTPFLSEITMFTFPIIMAIVGKLSYFDLQFID